MSRRKKVKKGLESVKKQIQLHEGKKRKAHEEGNVILEEYYEKEISQLENEVYRREKLLKRKKHG